MKHDIEANLSIRSHFIVVYYGCRFLHSVFYSKVRNFEKQYLAISRKESTRECAQVYWCPERSVDRLAARMGPESGSDRVVGGSVRETLQTSGGSK